MRVFVRMPNGEIIPMQVEPGSSVKSVKAQLRAEQGITASRLLLDFEPLDDAHTLADCNVSAEAVLECEPDDVLDLQLLLFLPKGEALFQSVYARLGQVQQLSSQADILLQGLVPGDGCEDLQTRLRKLPHLDETKYNTREYTALDRAAYDLSISKEPIDARLLQYFFEVLNRFMTSEKPEPRQHVLFLIISMILRNAIACGLSLAPESGPAYDQVRMVLSGTELSSPTLLTKEVIQALTVLRPILQRASKGSRLDARSICEVFRLPLELPQMLSLSIDGVKPEEKQEVDKLVLVIGTTGSGKSTLINCLTGIEYELCEDVTTGITFLQPKEGQPVPPAKVGHDVSSQTLYPQIIPAKDGPFCFCDCPGFDDNRRGDEAICAALGVPLAVHYSKKISAVILTVNYGFTEGRGNSLRLLNQTLSGIIKLPEQIQNFPLFFAFTKPPERKGAFQTSLLRKQLAVRISKIFAEATQQARLLPTKEKKLAKLEEELLVLSMSLDELQTLKKSAMDLGKARAGISIMAGLLGGFELIDISRIEKKVTELKAGWRERKFHERSVNDLGDTVRRGLHLQCREKGLAFLAEISRQIDVWKEGKVNLETQIKALMQEIDHIRGEEAISGLMLKQSANMFIIRGFKGAAQDEDDDLQRLYQAVSAETSEISREQFLFDPNNRTFDAVRQWIEGFSDQFTPKLQQMLFLQDDITNRLTTAIKDARLNIEQTKEDILSEVKGESDDHIAKSLKTQIERRSETLRKIKDHETQLRDESHHSEEEIERIRAAPVRDFRSELIEKSGWSFLPFGWSYRYDFHELDIFTRFFEKSGKSAIPIERVELSCVQENDDQKRVLFQTAIQEQFVDRNLAQNITANPAMQFEERAQNVHVVKSNQGSTVYGHFVVKQNKLDKGKFSVTYYSDEERKGRCAVRVFVLPQNLPAERTRMRDLELKLRDNRKDIENIAAKSTEISRNIASDEEYLALVKAGNRNQKSKILRIVELLSRLGACHEQEVVNLFGLDEATLASFQWLRNPAHSRCAQSLLRFKGQGFPEANLGINLRTLLAVMGVNLSLRVAVVESTQEVDGQRASLKLGEALLYRLEKKLRVLYKASDKSVDKFPILENHDYYNILLNGMTQGEGSGMGDFHAIALRVV